MSPDKQGISLELAPLHGVTGRVFRRAYLAAFPGFDSAMAPFILSVRVDRIKETHFKDLCPREEGGIPLVPQILGNDAEGFLATARVLADAGYPEVNWNLGCPYPMVADKGRGSGLLPFPDRITCFLDEVCPRLGPALSVKLRLGRRGAGEILALMPALNPYPLSRIILHARLGIQMYKGEVDLEGFGRAAALCAHRLAYNGDIKDPDTFRALGARFPGVQEWMIGRWALRDPFLAASLKGLAPPPEPLEAIRAFHAELYRSYRAILFGPAHVLDKMKEVWTYLGHNIQGAARELEALPRSKTLEAYEATVERIFAKGRWETPSPQGLSRK